MGAQAMTIAAGFQCSDGVVLCADTEISVPGFVKFPGSKIRMYNKLKARPVFTFAGDVLFCDMFIRKIAECLLLAEKSGDETLAAVEDEALRIHQRFRDEIYDAQSGLIMSLWLGSEGKKKRMLFEIALGIVSRVAETSIGTGQSVTRGIAAELFRSGMSVRETAIMTVYLLAEAKTYAYGCGKKSQILMLQNKGPWSVFPDEPYHPSIGEMEEDYFRLKASLGPVLLSHGDVKANPKTFAASIESFKTVVTASRKERLARIAELEELEIERQIDEYTQAQQYQDEGEEQEE
jgi:20S proteasome alpha/beta subunit